MQGFAEIHPLRQPYSDIAETIRPTDGFLRYQMVLLDSIGRID